MVDEKLIRPETEYCNFTWKFVCLWTLKMPIFIYYFVFGKNLANFFFSTAGQYKIGSTNSLGLSETNRKSDQIWSFYDWSSKVTYNPTPLTWYLIYFRNLKHSKPIWKFKTNFSDYLCNPSKRETNQRPAGRKNTPCPARGFPAISARKLWC